MQNSFERHYSKFDDMDKAVHARRLNLGHYCHVASHVGARQIVYANQHLPSINEAYCPTAAKPFCNAKSHYTRSMMTIYFIHGIDLEVATHALVLHDVNCQQLQKDGYCTAILERWIHHPFVKIITGFDGFIRVVDSMPLSFTFQLDCQQN